MIYKGDRSTPGSNAGAKEFWRFHLGTGFVERFRVDPDGPRGPQRSPAVPSDPEQSRRQNLMLLLNTHSALCMFTAFAFWVLVYFRNSYL